MIPVTGIVLVGMTIFPTNDPLGYPKGALAKASASRITKLPIPVHVFPPLIDHSAVTPIVASLTGSEYPSP